MAMLAPSLLAADFSNLREDIYNVEKGGADYLHLDVMDGIFVPNISFGVPVIESIRKITKLPFDTHLMVDRPERFIEDFVKAGSDIITVHQEATIHLHRTIQLIKSFGVKAGVSLNPSTPVESLEYIMDDIDLILIMSVNPGFGGQSFIDTMKHKIKKTRDIIDKKNYNIILEVDGGIKLKNARDIVNLGVDLVVAGSAIFGAEDMVGQTRAFKEVISR